MALDEPTDSDYTTEEEGITFCIENKLLQDTGGVDLDVSYMGFVVEPVIPFKKSGSSCSSCGSGGCSSGS